MDTHSLFIDPLSLDDFQLTLRRRLEEARAMVVALAVAATPALPALGEFHDAQEVSGRYRVLRDEYADRLQRLTDAITAAHGATANISDRYHTDEALFLAKAKDVNETLRPVREVLDGDRPRA